jgi:hypothetical protein
MAFAARQMLASCASSVAMRGASRLKPATIGMVYCTTLLTPVALVTRYQSPSGAGSVNLDGLLETVLITVKGPLCEGARSTITLPLTLVVVYCHTKSTACASTPRHRKQLRSNAFIDHIRSITFVITGVIGFDCEKQCSND